MKDEFVQMDKGITTQELSITTQAQSMKTKDNREFVPRAKEHVGTIASHLRDFKRMNSPTFHGS